MELQFAFFCDDARETPTGKLDATGIFHELYAPGFPAMQERMVLALVIDWDRKDQGRFNLKVELVSPAGAVVLTVDGHSEVEARPGDRAPARTRLVMPVEKVVFPQPGRYHLRVVVKGQRFRGPSLFLATLPEGESGGEEAGPA